MPSRQEAEHLTGRTLKIENGQREVSFDEALTLAVALNVPPPLLLLPLGTDDRVVIHERQRHPSSTRAGNGPAGEEPLASTARRATGGRNGNEAAEPLRLFRALRRARTTCARL